VRSGGAGVAYEPGLDGLRAIAVAVVLAFHADVPGFSGGFLGVSVFFTLSGFLITSLLLREHDTTGAIALRSFWGRRARRLLPASLLTLALVASVMPPMLDAVQRARLPADLAAAALDVANWRFLLDGQSYADLFAGPSPVLHFWSLAIEEQFYVVFPLVALVVLRRAGRRGVGVVALAGIGAAVAATLATGDPDVVYYATHTRAAELLAGVLLAVILHDRRPAAGRRPARIVAAGGVVGAGVLGLLVATTDQLDPGWYEGGLAAFSLVSVLLVLGALVAGPLRAVLTITPLVMVGRVSYGLYLFHWPVFLALTEDRIGLTGTLLLTARLGVTVAVTTASYHLLECPIRYRRLLPAMRPALTALAATAAVLLVAVVGLHLGRPTPAAIGSPAPASPARPLQLATPAPEPALPPPTKVLVVGSDRTAVDELAAGGADVTIVDRTAAGCPIAVDVVAPSAASCHDPLTTWPRLVKRLAPDVVVVAAGPADRAGEQLQPDTLELLRLGQVGTAVVATVDAVAGAGPPVLLVDSLSSADTVAGALSTAALRHPTVQLLDDPSGLAAAVDAITRPVVDDRTHVLVVGDSTSYLFASSLNRVAPDRFAVAWAGGNNCPVVPVAELRWWDGAQWDMSTCPQPETHWLGDPALDVVVVVASLTEQADQRYAGSDAWATPGDAAWVAAHEAWIPRAVAALAATGAVVVVADAPPIDGGAFSGSAMAHPERLAAWNATLAGWAQRWANVGVLGYAGPIAEREAQQGSIREDGVHLVPEALDELMAGTYADQLDLLVRSLRDRASASGCRTDGEPARLDPTRCDLGGAAVAG
jgi:peptidoglycan/LPS O-acetylase OafA/YrhL